MSDKQQGYLELTCEEEPADICEVIPYHDGLRMILRGHSADPYEETSVVIGTDQGRKLAAWLAAWLNEGAVRRTG